MRQSKITEQELIELKRAFMEDAFLGGLNNQLIKLLEVATPNFLLVDGEIKFHSYNEDIQKRIDDIERHKKEYIKSQYPALQNDDVPASYCDPENPIYGGNLQERQKRWEDDVENFLFGPRKHPELDIEKYNENEKPR